MDYEVVAAESFRRDYDSTADYLEHVLHSPQAAKRLVAAIRNAVNSLKSSPMLYAISCKPILEAHRMRECPVGNYVIVYHVDEKERVIRLHRLFHQLQQYNDEWYWE